MARGEAASVPGARSAPALLQLKAVHEQLAALSQAPVNKPKRKKEKKEKEKRKKDKDKERHKARSEDEKKARAAPPAKQAQPKKPPSKKASSTTVASRWACRPGPASRPGAAWREECWVWGSAWPRGCESWRLTGWGAGVLVLYPLCAFFHLLSPPPAPRDRLYVYPVKA